MPVSNPVMTGNLRYRVVAIGEQYHWIDRLHDQPLTTRDGQEARFDSLDKAITAFIDGKLSVERNEPLPKEAHQ